MKEIVDYARQLATSFKPISHTPEKPRFAGSLMEFDTMLRSKLRTDDFCMIIEIEHADWVNNHGAETDISTVNFFFFKKEKPDKFDAVYELLQESRGIAIKFYARLCRDKQAGASTLRFMDIGSKQFTYIKGEKGDGLFGCMLSITFKFPIAYAYNDNDWA